MKRILFRSIIFENFKCFANETFNFTSDNVTRIYGPNRAGKSTIADGIIWCLFGKNSLGSSQFDIKTRDSQGRTIREVPHSVTLYIRVDGEDMVIKRTLSENMKGDTIVNNYGYYIDSESLTAGDFKKAIAEIISEDVFWYASSPTTFLSLPWDEQRKFLSTIAGEIETHEITQCDARYDYLLEQMKKKSVDDIIKHLRYNIKDVQKSLDAVPARLSELGALLSKEKPSFAEQDLTAAEERVKLITDKLNAANNGAADEVAKQTIRYQIEFAEKRKDNIEKSARNEANALYDEYDTDLRNKTLLLNNTKQTVIELQAKQNAIKAIVKQCEGRIEELNKEKVRGSQRWSEITSRKWSWDEKSSFCPTCGQALPPERVDELMRRSEELFNAAIAEDKAKCIADAAKIKEGIKEANDTILSNQEELRKVEQQLADTGIKLAEAEGDVNEAKENKPKTYMGILTEKPEYEKVQKELDLLYDKLHCPRVQTDEQKAIIEQLQSELAEAKEQYQRLMQAKCDKQNYQNITDAIDKVNADKLTYQEQIDKYEEQLQTARDYTMRECEVLEHKVNEHFSYVQWCMFRQNLDGTQKPFCECTHDGIPYSSLNTADKINCGIDICHAIAKYYEVSIPVIIDNCESVLEPLHYGNQQIRMYVSDKYEHLNIQDDAQD